MPNDLAPRLALALLPTPIEKVLRTSLRMGIDLYVKRDDLTGGALGGNKARKLEYLFADAARENADTVITCGAVQSNHARAVAATAARLGLESELLLYGVDEPRPSGNHFLDHLFGAKVTIVTRDEYRRRGAIMAEMAKGVRRRGHHPYVIVEGGSDAVGSLGYFQAAAEIRQDEMRIGESFDQIVLATGSGGTVAGLLAGVLAYGVRAEVIAVPVCDDAAWFRARIDSILTAMRERFRTETPARAFERLRLIDGFKGRGYGLSTPEEIALAKRTARETGLVLDPVYTLKAWRCLESIVENGTIAKGSKVLFLHTAGIAAALAHALD